MERCEKNEEANKQTRTVFEIKQKRGNPNQFTLRKLVNDG